MEQVSGAAGFWRAAGAIGASRGLAFLRGVARAGAGWGAGAAAGEGAGWFAALGGSTLMSRPLSVSMITPEIRAERSASTSSLCSRRNLPRQNGWKNHTPLMA